MKGGGSGGVFRNSSNKTEPKKEEEVFYFFCFTGAHSFPFQPVVFKGRGKARWRPDDYDNYKFDSDSTPYYRILIGLIFVFMEEKVKKNIKESIKENTK